MLLFLNLTAMGNRNPKKHQAVSLTQTIADL